MIQEIASATASSNTTTLELTNLNLKAGRPYRLILNMGNVDTGCDYAIGYGSNYTATDYYRTAEWHDSTGDNTSNADNNYFLTLGAGERAVGFGRVSIDLQGRFRAWRKAQSKLSDGVNSYIDIESDVTGISSISTIGIQATTTGQIESGSEIILLG